MLFVFTTMGTLMFMFMGTFTRMGFISMLLSTGTKIIH